MATSLAAAIVKHTKIKPQLIEGRGGVFEIKADGKVIFSKKTEGRFPQDDEVIEPLKSMLK